MTTFANHPASKLLDFSQQLDINLLENVINTMHHGTGSQQQVAQELLNNLMEHPDAWTKVDMILQSSKDMQTKYYALQMLERLVQTRWKTLTRNQSEAVKKFVVQSIIEISHHPAIMEKEGARLLRLNAVVVEILKQEWPDHWPNFIYDIVGASVISESLCENNMAILKLFCEEVLDFSRGQTTHLKAKHLKDHLRSEFPQLFKLCLVVMDNSQNARLVNATLETLLLLLHCALGAEFGLLDYIGETNLTEYLIRFLNVPMFHNVVLGFLRAHWVLLKVVVKKLFEFMHQTQDGVRDMACNTFLTVAQKCRHSFVQVQEGETVPFINEILHHIQAIIRDLQPQQVHVIYEAVGCMIEAQEDQEVQVQLIKKYMRLPNQEWKRIIMAATKNVNILLEEMTLGQLAGILEVNVTACRAVGHLFVVQLGQIYLDMLHVYKLLSAAISTAIRNNGETVTKVPHIQSMMMVKRQILKLISGWVSCSDDPQVVADMFVPPLLDAVLLDYQNNVPAARDPEVLRTVATVVNKLGDRVSGQIPQIFDAVFDCTWNMMKRDFEAFPEHRIHFFSLLKAAMSQCSQAFLSFAPAQFNIVRYTILWAFKHTMRNVANAGLQTLYTVLQTMSAREAVTKREDQTFFTDILQLVLSVVTDMPPSWPAYSQLEAFVVGLFSLHKDIPAFTELLRNFLLQIQEFSGQDSQNLFLEERDLALLQAQEN
ncbi:exportin-1-like [Aulostomus maculatus]